MSVLRKHPLIAFFVVAYAVTWAASIPMFVAAGNGVPPTEFDVALFLVAGSAGPTIAAFLMSRIAAGPAGVRELVARLSRWRAPVRYWLFALLFFPAAMFTAAAIHTATGGTIDWTPIDAPYDLPRWAMLVSIPLLATLEEIGWRGYALPRMLARRSPLVASLVLGVVWALWHGPAFFIDGSPQQGAPFLFYVATVVLLSIPMTWLYQNTRSALLTSVLHMSNNFTVFLPTTRSLELMAIFGSIGLLMTIGVIVRGRMHRRPDTAPGDALQPT